MQHAEFKKRFTHLLADLHAAFRIGVGQEQHELFAAVAGCQICRPANLRVQDPRQRTQAGISGLVTIMIIELLEIVDVDQQQR